MEDPNRHQRTMCKGESLYRVLGLEKGASPDEIKRAYRKLSLRYHPDKNPDNPEAAKKFKEINKAYSVLGNEDLRIFYDQYGSLGLQIIEPFGEKGAKNCSSTCWFPTLLVFCGIITCCYCGFGCCFCCFCCCGMCKNAEDKDFPKMNLEDLEDGSEDQEPGENVPVVVQPH